MHLLTLYSIFLKRGEGFELRAWFGYGCGPGKELAWICESDVGIWGLRAWRYLAGGTTAVAVVLVAVVAFFARTAPR